VSPGPTWLPVSGDCADDDPAVNPAAREVCNGIDDDCDGRTDDADAGVDPSTFTRWYNDVDNDGYGNIEVFLDQCTSPPGGIDIGGDCNDERQNIHPGQPEVCNTIDDDCDGLVDDYDPDVDPADQTLFFSDTDGDGYGDPANQSLACASTPGYGVDNDLDCDDGNVDANIDQWWYTDADQDGFGAGDPVVFQCLDPGQGLAPEYYGLDCDDFDPFENPGVIEVCDDIVDQNCDLAVDCDDSDCAGVEGCLAECADEQLPSPTPATASGSTIGTGNDVVPTFCAATSTAEEFVYQWVPPADGLYTIDTVGSNYDTVLYVLDGCGGNEITCNDDFFGVQSQVTVTAQAGVPLLVVVDGYGANAGDYVLTIQ
jgi:hypothetical protein